MLYRPGDRVLVKTGFPQLDGPGTVRSVGSKNYVVTMDNKPRGTRAPHSSVIALDDAAPTVEFPTFVPKLGQVVRFTGALARQRPELYVVFGNGYSRGTEVIKVTALGGTSDGRYYNVPALAGSLADANAEVL